MSTANVNANQPEAVAADAGEITLMEQVAEWFREEGAWWLGSLVFHMLLLCVLAMITVKMAPEVFGGAPSLDAVEEQPLEEEKKEEKIDPEKPFDVAETPEEPTELSTETLTLEAPGQIEQTEKYYDDNPVFSEAGGGSSKGNPNLPEIGGTGGFNVMGTNPGGPALKGGGGVGRGTGTGEYMGIGGDGTGFGGRGTGYRKAMVGRFGGTKQSERAVAGALNWLARHQNRDGSWSQDGFRARCADQSCTGPGGAKQDVGTTALGLLPFLAAGQTHKSKGPYQAHIAAAVNWLIRQQKTDGDLRGPHGTMYSHGLAAIALCEAYGMTKGYGMAGDPIVGRAAQGAINFIQAAQHGEGGWRYNPRDAGDTSVVGWQVMALKSGQMAGLAVNPACLEGAKKFLDSVASGYHKEQFAYMPKGNPTECMTAVGLLCSQYLGAKRNDPQIVDGGNYLVNHLPDPEKHRNVYYWYYATQVMHNLTGPQWDTWNRHTRKTLISTQEKEGCASGSWSPDSPSSLYSGRCR